MVTLYTTHCPKCNVIAKKLEQKGIEFKINEDLEDMIAMGFHSAPILQVDEKYLNFTEANNWIKEQG